MGPSVFAEGISFRAGGLYVYPSQRLKVCELLPLYISAKLRKIHFAEEWNELHHLLIMEALGGDARYPHVYTHVYTI